MLNMIGLIGFAWAVRVYLPAREREPWLWGLALQAVSPFAIRMSRKIWPPSTLTPLLLLLWISHQHRQSRWGAFAWGLVGALIGQVHLSGWFVAAGLFIGTVAAERLRCLPRSQNWRRWLLGTVLGLAIALPWASACKIDHLVLRRAGGDGDQGKDRWLSLRTRSGRVEPRFLFRYWGSVSIHMNLTWGR